MSASPLTSPRTDPKGNPMIDLTELDPARGTEARDRTPGGDTDAVRRLSADSPGRRAAGTPATPRHPLPRTRRRPDVKKWWSRLLVLAMIAGAVYGGTKLVEYRTTQQQTMDIGTVTLTARATAVSPSQLGVVKTVAVNAEDTVKAGARLGTVTTTTVTGNGRVETAEIAVRAPSDGVVVADPMPVGATVAPGQAFVSIYDPADMTFVGDVKIDTLTHLSRGMTVTLTGPGLAAPVTAKVERVAPRVVGSTDDVAAGAMQLVLTPAATTQVADLVPGYQLTGSVQADPDATPAGGGILSGS